MSDLTLSPQERRTTLVSISGAKGGAAPMAGSLESQRRMSSYDFRRPGKVGRDQLRTLQMMHESFSRLLQTALSRVLRLHLHVELLSVSEMSYEEFVRGTANPSVLGIVGAEPLEGSILLHMDSDLAFVMIDRLLGGPGTSVTKRRPLTDIEQSLIRRVSEQILSALEETWRPVRELTTELQRTETNPHFVQAAPPLESTLVIRHGVHIRDMQGFITLCIPYSSLQSVASELRPEVWLASTDQSEIPESCEEIRKHLETVMLPVRMELGTVDVSMGDLLGLKVGDVVRLNTKSGEALPVYVSSRRKFWGLPGQVGSRLAVQIVDATREDDV